MKKMIVLAVCMLLVTSAAFAATIVGTPHDLSATGPRYQSTSNEICVFCHTPHGGSTTVPLWNKTDTATAFTMYTAAVSSSFQATADANLSGASLACMTCHDGVASVATNLLNNSNASPALAAGTAGGGVNAAGVITGGNALLGTNLSNDHPVSFVYDATLATADGELVSPATPAVAALLFNTKVQCASCHDVHNNTNVPFLVMSNSGSALCLTCHIK